MTLQAKTETPLFLIWAILKSCPIKESFDFDFENESNLLGLERTFRPLRCLSEAKAEGRMVGDLCILQPRCERPNQLDSIKGFSASEILEGFGGEEYLNFHCQNCSANVFRIGESEAGQGDAVQGITGIAGCYGYLQSEYDENRLFERWQAELEFELYEIWEKEKLETRNTLSSIQMEKLSALLNNDKLQDVANADTMSLAAAIKCCQSSDLKLQIHVVPKSQIVDRNWIVPQHCSNCYESLGKWHGHCPRCRTNRPPVSLRKRLLRGDRPYWPLVRFLGTSGAEQIAEQYFECISNGE